VKPEKMTREIERPCSAMVFYPYKHVFRLVAADSNQYESFATYPSNGSTSLYRCELCDESMRGDCIDTHCCIKARDHRLNQWHVFTRHPPARACAELQHRADQLGLRAWRADVESKLFWILLNAANDRGGFQMIPSARALVEKYERRERMALLELAVWKAVCILHPERCDIAVKRKGYLAQQNWARHEWREHKAALRTANEIDIVITCVLPFLRCGKSCSCFWCGKSFSCFSPEPRRADATSSGGGYDNSQGL
jgi:hypothetical protein